MSVYGSFVLAANDAFVLAQGTQGACLLYTSDAADE